MWHLRDPARHRLAFRQPVEGRVDLDRLEVLRVVLEPAIRGQPLRIEELAPRGVVPARAADVNWPHDPFLTLVRMKDVLRAAATAAFVVGLILMMVNPPSLSGAEDLLSLLAGALALMLLTAWVTVALMERDSMSEQEFERLVETSERLAAQPQRALAESEFELLVAEAIDELPQEFQEALQTVPVVVSQLGSEHRAYGHYYGDTIARENYEDRIVIYQDTLERDFGHDPDLLRAQVTRTLRHEVAHHLGWGEKGVRGLGL